MILKPSCQRCLKPKCLPSQVPGDGGDMETVGVSDDNHHTPELFWINSLPVPECCVAFYLSLDNSEPLRGVSLKLME